MIIELWVFKSLWSYVILGKLMKIINEETVPSQVIEKYYYIVKKTKNIAALFLEDIRSKCVLASYEENWKFVVPLVNNLETD